MSIRSLTRSRLAAALAVVACIGAPAAALAQDGYVTLRDAQQLLLLDPTNPTDVSQRINFGAPISGVAVSPDGSTVYVTENTSVRVIDSGVVDPSPIGLGAPLEQLVVTPDGNKLYVTDPLVARVHVIDLAGGNAVSSINFNFGDSPWDVDVATTAGGVFAYVSLGGTSATADVVKVIDTSTDAVVATIPVGTRPQGVAASPSGDLVYVANAGDNSISVIETTSNAVLATIAVGSSPQELAVSPDGGLVYVTLPGVGSVAVIDAATLMLEDPIPLGDDSEGLHGISFSTDGSRVVVAHSIGDQISVIDPTDGNSVVTVGSSGGAPLDGPRYVAFAPPEPAPPDSPPSFGMPLCDIDLTADIGELLDIPLSVTDDAGVVVTLHENPATGGAMQPPLPTPAAMQVESHFLWTPSSADVGAYALEFRADDGVNSVVACTVNVNVPEPPEPDETPFASFGLQQARLQHHDDGVAFWFNGFFEVDQNGGDGVAPAAEEVTLVVEKIEWTLAPGSLEPFGRGRHFQFRSTVDGTALFVHLIRVGPPESGRFRIVVRGRGAAIDPAQNPLELCLRIGDDAGCASTRGRVR